MSGNRSSVASTPRMLAFGLLGLGLLLFSTIDGDGDPLTANGPPIVIAAESPGLPAGCIRKEIVDLRAQACDRVWRHFRRSAGRWLRHGRVVWVGQVHPIRGP